MNRSRLGTVVVLTATGILDTRTYRQLRDEIVKAALEEPTAVLVEVSDLRVPAPSAWAVFTSARWLVSRWPEVPIILVCRDAPGRRSIVANAVSRHVPVFSTIESASDAVSQANPPRYRHRARAELPPSEESLTSSRKLVEECLTAWAQTDLIPVTNIIVTTLVENVLRHTDSAPNVRLEFDGRRVTVAVEDGNPAPAAFRETPHRTDLPTGLRVVSALCSAWGNAPTPSGKTIWAVIGPEDRLP